MPAFIIVDIQINDPAIYEEYKKLAPPSIAQYGGKYIARGGETEVLEGDWTPKRIVILQFESLARAKEWINSTEYAPVRRMRQQCATTRMILTEGL